ncbi:hypothetical protein, variant [Cryptococcus amylolentus CBS 6039]|uniref:M-phase inducer phosphatase n=2 Tax=Cryptococcus amylolentus TaxID=104669 RepID=A0A1E3HK30_9TREE|nr:hypothetical protein L202_05325 [Cryptococcus amylolentus CBS 6039]XP_018992064.1 hypothetical protein, variant [Cryptococcus amylolentus CBS 6039]ODN76689.1 hypothetical protein L202_05325 [Cryptococcus amylolentus CBS 6039]ODN76690.1 hypothetical protein, variant [Cryptococcus amylolentus CBS 6039]ODO04646.1 hypothetical protein I350_05255 [Cryptococcus amylolentus CBS 6273]
MSAFGSSPLMDAFPTHHFSEPPSPTKTETDDLPMEVDQSFSSSLSISDSPAFSPTPAMGTNRGSGSSNLLPTPPAFSLKPRRPDPVPVQVRPSPRSKTFGGSAFGSKPLGRERSFGTELSTNGNASRRSVELTKNGKGKMLPPSIPESRMLKVRGSVPMQWSSSNEEMGSPGPRKMLGVPRTESDPLLCSPVSGRSPRTIDDNDMDVDSPRPLSASAARRGSLMASPAFGGPASLNGSPGLGSFFCDSPGQPVQAPPAKRRSLVTPASPSSSSPSAKRASFGLSRPPLEKTASVGPMLFGSTRNGSMGTRRGMTGTKRPTLGPLSATTGDASRMTSASSAFPILYGPPAQTLGSGQSGTFPRAAMAPMRRAYSVCDQQKAHEVDDDESEFENSPSLGTHAEYARRYDSRMASHVDGSPGFKPSRASIAASGEGVASPMGKKISPYGPGGLPGFGDNEIDGKILPCHKVKEDGLVRITPDTLDSLLDGKYNDKLKRFHVIDCRFQYEYEGGHIAGAVNVKSMDALDRLLLSEDEGLHANGETLPTPSRSGELPDGQPVVLVFHCEFSAKRAPTFAKHLRSRDRLLNNAIYPRIFYPEIYILEGGYCGFYQTRSDRCDPKGYTRMDDPEHFHSRDSDLHEFRKFSRTRSFTYGESQQAAAQTSRALPPCPPMAFAAASAAAARRNGASGVTIKEEDDGEPESSPHPGDSSAEVDFGTDASPCPRGQVVSLGQPPLFGSARPRTLGRMGFARVASYAGSTNPNSTGSGFR